jgi:hypothetical protein
MAIQFDHTANGLVTITTTNAASPSPYTLRLPNGTGSNGQVLTTDGTGNLSFTTTATTYDSLTTKPAVNVTFTGDVTGAGNVLLSNSGTNLLSIALTTTTAPTAFIYCSGNTITSCGITQHPVINTNQFNFFAGQNSGNAITTGGNNIGFGFGAGCSLTTGSFNFFAGACVARFATTAQNNIAIGCRAAGSLTTGVGGIFIGGLAGSNNSFGRQNIFLGSSAGATNSTGSYNIFLGLDAGLYVTTGCRNFFAGACSGTNITTGNDNIMLGCLTDGSAITGATSNTIIFATGGITRFFNQGALGNTTITGNVIATNTFFGSGSGLTGIVLGTNTTGNFVASVSAGLGVTVTGGTGVGSTPTIAANVRSVGTFTGDVSNTQLLSSILQVDGAGSNLDADLLDGQQGTYYLNYTNITQKPAANITLTGDVTGSVSNVLQANSTVLSLATTLANSGVTAGSYGNANVVPQITVDAKGRVTAASNVVIDRNYATVTNKPSVNITFTGDVTGIANVNLANQNTNAVSVALTIAADSVALGTDTTGNYVANVIAGAGIVASGGGSETSTVTISHLDTSSVGNVSSDNSNGVVIQDVILGFDTFGHVTGASVATVDLDSRFLRLSTTATQFVTGPVDFQGNVVFSGNVITVTANNLIVEDNIIQLAKNNTTDALDFGFIGHYSAGNANVHAGFFRDASDSGIWKVFENYPIEPSTDANIDTANVSYREASFKANILFGNSVNLTNISGNSVVATGNIFTSGNLIVGQEVRTSGGGVYWHSLNDGVGSGLDADLLDGFNGSYYLDYVNITQKPAANITLTGDVTGTVSNVLQANSTILSLAATLASTGVTATTYGNAKIVPRFTVDAKGRLTNAANTTIALDYADLVTKPSINLIFTGGATGSGNLIVSNTNTNSLSVALSLVEADTLATVTGRGATTATAVTFTNATEATSNNSGAVQVTGGLGVSGNIYGNRVIVTGRGHGANVGLNSAIIGGSNSTNRGANSFIGGGVGNSINADGILQSAIIAGTFNSISSGTSNSIILAGVSNTVNVSFETALLGSKNTLVDTAIQGFSIGSSTGTLAFGCNIGEIGSTGAQLSGCRAIVIGSNNSATGSAAQNAVVLGADTACVNSLNSAIVGGSFSNVTANSSVILGGAYGAGDVRGKVIMPGHGWTIWNAQGSAQIGKQTLVNQTSTAAGSNVLINGSGAADFTNSIGIRNNHVYVVKGTITAANATGTTKVWDYTTSAKANATGAINFVGNYGTGNAIINTIAADPGTDTWAVRFVSGRSGTTGWITANVTGNTSTIRWLLTSETSELKFA